MNIRLYASCEGNCPSTPSTVPWYVCCIIPANTGPTDIPTRFSSRVIPRAMPVICIGTETSITLNPPVIESESPAASIVSPTETMVSVEWNMSRMKNPTVLIAVPLGVYSAIKHNSLLDHAGMSIALIGVSLPNFWLGIMLIYFLGGQLNLLPVAGRIEYGIEIKTITGLYLFDSLMNGNFAAFWSAFQHLLMPAFTLGSALAAIVTRISRSSVLEVMRQDYVTTARAKGLSEKAVIWRHILRNALITIITILGLQLGALLSGSVVTETVFSYPGIGDLLIQSISARDYKLTQVLILMFAVTYFVVNLLVDLLHSWIDPRIRF